MTTRKLVVSTYDVLFQLTTRGRIKQFQGRYDPKPWVTIDNNQDIEDIICADHLYQLLKDGCIERFNGPDAKDWTPIDGKSDDPKMIYAGGESILKQNLKTFAVDMWEHDKEWHQRHFDPVTPTHSDQTKMSKLVSITSRGGYVAYRTPDHSEKFAVRWTRWEPSGAYNRYFWQLGGSEWSKELDTLDWLLAYKDIVYLGNRTKIISIDRTHKDDFQRVYTGNADIDSPIEQVVVGKAGLFRLHQNGKIFKRTVLYSHWMLISDQKTNIEIAVGRHKVFRRTVDNGIFEWDAQYLKWTVIQPEIGDEDD